MNIQPQKSGIKYWAVDDRPREKMLSKGKSVLSDAELIAILIGSGNNTETAVELSRKILASVQNNLAELSRLNISDLMKFKGIGEAKAISIVAAMELGKRRRSAEALEKKSIKSSKDAYECMYMNATDLQYEKFWVLLLDQSHKLIRIAEISEGGVAGTVADPKKIFRIALEYNASSIIICHNHPSGQLIPSDADKNITKKIVHSGQMLDIKVLDHLIIGHDNYFSFSDEGIL